MSCRYFSELLASTQDDMFVLNLDNKKITMLTVIAFLWYDCIVTKLNA